MKAKIIPELERIAGDRLTSTMREEIAESVVKIMNDLNRTKALDVMSTLTEKIVKENNGKS